MSDWVLAAVCLSYVLSVWLVLAKEKSHRQEIDKIHDTYQKERQELLDRIMANNIQEFKTANQTASVKRSENGNFLMDRMTKAAKQYSDLE